MDQNVNLNDEERDEVDRNQRMKATVVYEIIRRQGLDELKRPKTSLWWSGVAAGLGISTSVFCEGFLHLHLPDEPWRPLVENFGYCIGFLIVIIGGFQLFTEQTVTPVLPLLANRSRKNFVCTARLWAIVLLANLAGTMLAALLATYVIAQPEQLDAFLSISRHFAEKTPAETFLHGIPAGFFVAALVWMLPSSRGSEFWVIVSLTYMIALGDFAHVVAGSTEVFLLVLAGEMGLLSSIVEFVAPAFLGNVIGGTVLFSLIAYGQVQEEL